MTGVSAAACAGQKLSVVTILIDSWWPPSILPPTWGRVRRSIQGSFPTTTPLVYKLCLKKSKDFLGLNPYARKAYMACQSYFLYDPIRTLPTTFLGDAYGPGHS